MEKLEFTPEQEAAIHYREGALLVAAAAGSGKTKVLVERLLSLVSEGSDIGEFLVITYTRAAASELRERILDKISERLAADPENRRLRRQALLCRSAHIDTIHAFCTSILRENAHSAQLPPDFRVADESECDLIKTEVMENVLNAAYENIGNSHDFRELVDTLSFGRDDKRLVEIVFDAHSKLQSNPNPHAWAKKQIENLSMSGVSDVSSTPWGTQLLGKARGVAGFWLGQMKYLEEEMECLPDFERTYGASISTTIAGLSVFLNALDVGWDEARRTCAIEFPGAKPVKGYEELKEIRNRCKTAIKKFAEMFENSSDEHIEDMCAAAPAMTALLRLILEFDSAYSEEKRRRGVVDFSDLEHLTLTLLTDGATGEKTKLAHAISGRFAEIMVDEYQDVNAVQELIFNALSRDGSNIFMVGDVKQSIYRFRLADPSIFLAKYNSASAQLIAHNSQLTLSRFPDQVNVTPHAVVLLSKNFRSQAGILEAVNYVFSNIMSIDFGEMEYSEREWLIPGRSDIDETAFGEGETEPTVEFDIIDMSADDSKDDEDEDEESPSKIQAEARHIAERIAEIMNRPFLISDGQGGRRCVQYSDIAILLRSVKNKAWQYAQALSEHGIPVDLPGGEGFFETIEVSAALSLLSVIDNPMQDIPLTSALRGPVYGFSADELAAIRMESRQTDFYTALLKAAETDEKCASFLSDIDEMRALAPDMTADRFIWHVYNKTGLPGLVGAMRGGVRRRENLMLLAEAAHVFEQNGYKGLFGFLTYVLGLQEKGAEFSKSAAAGAVEGSAVKIMSIHKSKGLEFPIVILADMSKKINTKDGQKPLVMHEKLGVGAMRTDNERRITYPTIARMAIQSKLLSEMRGEELRVLYVAMTRAREKLIITAAYKDARKELEKLSKIACEKIQSQALDGINNMAGWILAPLLSAAKNSELKVGNGEKVSVQVSQRSAVSVHVTAPPLGQMPEYGVSVIDDGKHAVSRPQTSASELSIPTSDSDSSPSCDVLCKRFSFVYPYQGAPDLPSKITVTELKGRLFESDADFEAQPAGYVKPRNEYERCMHVHFTDEKSELTAAERGTALHLTLQHIDYSECGSLSKIHNQLKILVDSGILSKQHAAAVDAQKITRFFESEIGKRVINGKNVKREFKISLLCQAESLYPGGGDDRILMQGMVDCFFEEDGELVVVDYKTDNVKPETVQETANHYKPQLDAYSQALERITGMRVKSSFVYFFSLDACITV